MTVQREYASDPGLKEQFSTPKGPYVLKIGQLFLERKLCVPNVTFRKQLLHDHHTVPFSGYLGEARTRRTKSSPLLLENPPS